MAAATAFENLKTNSRNSNKEQLYIHYFILKNISPISRHLTTSNCDELHLVLMSAERFA